MLDSIYHRTLNLLKNNVLGVKTSIICHLLRITLHTNLLTTSVLSILLHGVISLPGATSFDNAT